MKNKRSVIEMKVLLSIIVLTIVFVILLFNISKNNNFFDEKQTEVLCNNPFLLVDKNSIKEKCKGFNIETQNIEKIISKIKYCDNILKNKKTEQKICVYCGLINTEDFSKNFLEYIQDKKNKKFFDEFLDNNLNSKTYSQNSKTIEELEKNDFLKNEVFVFTKLEKNEDILNHRTYFKNDKNSECLNIETLFLE